VHTSAGCIPAALLFADHGRAAARNTPWGPVSRCRF
jgi:hypothetical protein